MAVFLKFFVLQQHKFFELVLFFEQQVKLQQQFLFKLSVFQQQLKFIDQFFEFQQQLDQLVFILKQHIGVEFFFEFHLGEFQLIVLLAQFFEFQQQFLIFTDGMPR